MIFKGSRKIVGGLVLAAGFALTGVVAVAQQREPEQGGEGRAERRWDNEDGGKGRRGGRMHGGGRFERLNLTDAQREQMRQIAERYEATFSAQRGERGERRGERRGFDPFAGGAFDESAVRAAAQARANAQVEREVAQARMMHEMYNVLTSEQKAQLAADRQQREQRRSRRGARQGQTQLQ
ncbi:MAG TPA: Spy/CpxP family protein refolding chaperone [Pyrinomonadaceae bacterium]|jgi:Spy/CpxP family protein refolding chaperone